MLFIQAVNFHQHRRGSERCRETFLNHEQKKKSVPTNKKTSWIVIEIPFSHQENFYINKKN
jgi:hypothetical protein